jgi:hypothetical protein
VAELTTAALPGIAGVLLGLCADPLLRHRAAVSAACGV